jgi:opacity protein-like surface antigen
VRYRNSVVVPLAALGMAIGQPALAAEPDRWQYEITPYLLGAAMNGTAGVKGLTVPVDASFSDILENLDAGLMGLVTAQKGRWTFMLEGVYMNLGAERSGPVAGVVSANVDTKLYIGQGSIGYRLLDDGTRLDLMGGLRWTKLSADIDLVGPNNSVSVGSDDSWTDAVVGVRVLHPVADSVALLGYADVGAGGSDLTWQVVAGVNWEFAKGFTLKAGYRHMYWDYEDGGTVWDMSASGPYLGLGIRF